MITTPPPPDTAAGFVAAAEASLADLQWLVSPAGPRPVVAYSVRDDMGTVAGLTRRLGDGSYLLHFNMHVLLRLSRQGQRELLHHELAHVIDDVLFGWSHDVHGQTWRCLMRLMGHDDPTACHAVDVKDLVGAEGMKMLPALCRRCGRHVAVSAGDAPVCWACRVCLSPPQSRGGLCPRYDGRVTPAVGDITCQSKSLVRASTQSLGERSGTCRLLRSSGS